MQRVVRRFAWLVRPGRAIAAVLLILVIASALRSHVNRQQMRIDPALTVHAQADVPASVLATLRHACFDCHSEETRWPWYAALPVASWLLERDVNNGRGQVNFSRWGEYNEFDRADMLDKICERARTRTMPLWPYRLLHAEARLSDADIDELCAWTEQEATRLAGGGS